MFERVILLHNNQQGLKKINRKHVLSSHKKSIAVFNLIIENDLIGVEPVHSGQTNNINYLQTNMCSAKSTVASSQKIMVIIAELIRPLQHKQQCSMPSRPSVRHRRLERERQREMNAESRTDDREKNEIRLCMTLDVRILCTVRYYILLCYMRFRCVPDRMGTASTKWISLRSFSSPHAAPPHRRVFDLS